jgi:hypothetical protein
MLASTSTRGKSDQSGDHGTYACLDVDLDWLSLLNAATLDRNAGLVYSEVLIDSGVRVWVVTELVGDTTVLTAWERLRVPPACVPRAEPGMPERDDAA